MARLKKSDFDFLIVSVQRRIKRAAKKNKIIRFNLTANYLRKQFETQSGLCPCCGIELDLKGKTHVRSVAPDMKASVDRIVPGKGYVRGNIALLHCCCNRFKGQLDGNTMYAIAKRITELYEKTYPNIKVAISNQLTIGVDGRNFMFPRYSVVASTSKKVAGSADATMRPNYTSPDTVE